MGDVGNRLEPLLLLFRGEKGVFGVQLMTLAAFWVIYSICKYP